MNARRQWDNILKRLRRKKKQTEKNPFLNDRCKAGNINYFFKCILFKQCNLKIDFDWIKEQDLNLYCHK